MCNEFVEAGGKRKKERKNERKRGHIDGERERERDREREREREKERERERVRERKRERDIGDKSRTMKNFSLAQSRSLIGSMHDDITATASVRHLCSTILIYLQVDEILQSLPIFLAVIQFRTSIHDTSTSCSL